MQSIPNVLPGNRLQFVNETDSILSGVDIIDGREYFQHGPDSKFENFKLKRDCDDSDDLTLQSSLPFKKTKGRVKIKMEYIDNKLRRYTTFSKRKTGIMKKAYELSKLTGTQVMLLVASETGHVYTFATQKLQPMITSEGGKTLIQTCLNSPDGMQADEFIGTDDIHDDQILNTQNESIVPCDSTSIENSLSKDMINKLFETEPPSNAIFPSPSSYYQCVDSRRPVQLHTTNLMLHQQTVTLQPTPSPPGGGQHTPIAASSSSATSASSSLSSTSLILNATKSTTAMCHMTDAAALVEDALNQSLPPSHLHPLHAQPSSNTDLNGYSTTPTSLQPTHNQQHTTTATTSTTTTLNPEDILYATLDTDTTTAAALTSQLSSTTHDAQGKPLSRDTAITTLNENNEIMRAQIKKLMFNQSLLLRTPSIDESFRKSTNLKLRHLMKTLDADLPGVENL